MPKLTDVQNFLEKIRQEGGRISNPRLQNLLSWNDDKYWRIHQQHIDEGNVERGKGKGGTVILVDKQNPTAAADVAAASPVLDKISDSYCAPIIEPFSRIAEYDQFRESHLYDPALKQMQDHWARRRQLDQCHCEITAHKGRRDTGGSWSRPDITVIGYKKYEFLPERLLEIFTFEIKPDYDVSVKGVLEALSHREAATRSYVIFATSGREFNDFPESARIEEIAARHGVGVFAAQDISDFNTWEVITSATRAVADPENLENFIKKTLTDEARIKLRKWF